MSNPVRSATRDENLDWFTPTDAPEDADRFLVAVIFRVGKIGIPVIAESISPESCTIVMRIVDGEGLGSLLRADSGTTHRSHR
jgi:hypothetical protein